ncbi:hypothetical protein ACWD8I_32490, partial [Micromonospora arida]
MTRFCGRRRGSGLDECDLGGSPARLRSAGGSPARLRSARRVANHLNSYVQYMRGQGVPIDVTS